MFSENEWISIKHLLAWILICRRLRWRPRKGRVVERISQIWNNNCLNQNGQKINKTSLLQKRQSKESSSAILSPSFKYSVVDSVKSFFLCENLVSHSFYCKMKYSSNLWCFIKWICFSTLIITVPYLDSWPAFCHHKPNVLFQKILPTVC